MWGNSQTASARLRAEAPARRWSAWLTRAQEQRRRARLEELITAERLQSEARRARQSGASASTLRPWL
jgi:hypothetical protein